jgi:hypothetical protein
MIEFKLFKTFKTFGTTGTFGTTEPVDTGPLAALRFVSGWRASRTTTEEGADDRAERLAVE